MKNSKTNSTQTVENPEQKNNAIIKYSRAIYLASLLVLVAFMIVSIVLTYVLPKGHFEVVGGITDYNKFVPLENAGGINIFKGIFAPIMMFTADGFLQPLMLIVFLLTIAGVFQVMINCGGMQAIVSRFVNKFKTRKFLFLAICTLFFMILGSCFGLFEETLLLLPMVMAICLSLGYDLSVSFMVCTLATGIGFSVGITNPFTVVYASTLIGASVTRNIWFRLLVFLIYYFVVMGFVYLKARKAKAPQTEVLTPTEKVEGNDKRKFIIYTVFLLVGFATVLIASSVPALRDYSIVILIAVFLIGGLTAGFLAFGRKNTFKGMWQGVKSALPSVVMVLLAFSIKYILVEGQVIDTITHLIQQAIVGKSTFAAVLTVFAIILVLEFFVSSSTAKAVFVMGVLSGVSSSGALNVSPELIVLVYLFSDGFTNVLFPTSPVLLIGLSMTGQSYLTWIKKSWLFFIVVFLLAIAIIGLAMVIGY